MEPIILGDGDLARENLLKTRIQELANRYGLPEIEYETSFSKPPHFFLKTTLESEVKEKAIRIYEFIFAPIEP